MSARTSTSRSLSPAGRAPRRPATRLAGLGQHRRDGVVVEPTRLGLRGSSARGLVARAAPARYGRGRRMAANASATARMRAAIGMAGAAQPGGTRNRRAVRGACRRRWRAARATARRPGSARSSSRASHLLPLHSGERARLLPHRVGHARPGRRRAADRRSRCGRPRRRRGPAGGRRPQPARATCPGVTVEERHLHVGQVAERGGHVDELGTAPLDDRRGLDLEDAVARVAARRPRPGSPRGSAANAATTAGSRITPARWPQRGRRPRRRRRVGRRTRRPSPPGPPARRWRCRRPRARRGTQPPDPGLVDVVQRLLGRVRQAEPAGGVAGHLAHADVGAPPPLRSVRQGERRRPGGARRSPSRGSARAAGWRATSSGSARLVRATARLSARSSPNAAAASWATADAADVHQQRGVEAVPHVGVVEIHSPGQRRGDQAGPHRGPRRKAEPSRRPSTARPAGRRAPTPPPRPSRQPCRCSSSSFATEARRGDGRSPFRHERRRDA